MEEFKFTGAAEILQYQCVEAFAESQGVKDLVEANPCQTTFEMALNMYLMGYIEGKRAERAGRKKESV